MRIEWLICPLVVGVALTAAADPLERRFGAERERGYRAERGLREARPGFENRDRSNFLGIRRPLKDDSGHPAATFVRPCPSACSDS